MKLFTVCFLFAAVTGMAQEMGVTWEAHPAVRMIQQDLATDRLTQDEYYVNLFRVVFEPDRLPEKYREGLGLKIKCATPLMMAYAKDRELLDATTRDLLDGYLRRPFETIEAVYISPGGRFELTYQTTGGNAVPTTDINPPNGIPDYVERCAEYFDYCWLKEIDTLGFAGPYNSVTMRYRIGFENMGAYGYTTTTGDSVGTRIVVHRNFIGFPPNDDPDGDQLGAMKVTNAHEFKHASQFTNSYWSEGGWVELDATWMEDIAYDATNDYYNYIEGGGSPFTAPGTALDDGGTGSYEDCNWQLFMSEKYGTQIITDLWIYRQTHGWEPMLTSYDNILTTYGSNLASAFKEYATWNMMSGSRAVPGFGYGEAAAYPTSQLCRTHTSLPAAGTQCSLDHLAANFIRINSDLSNRNLHVLFNGPVGEEMRLMLVFRHQGDSVTTEEVPLDAYNSADHVASPRLNGVVYAGLIPVMTQTYGGAFTYAYSVETVPGLAITHVPYTGVVDSAAAYPVTAQIVSYGAELDTQQLFLHYGTGAFTDSVILTPTGSPNQYSADIPGAGNNTSIRYYLSALDASGLRVTLPQGAPDEYYEFSIGHDVIPPNITHVVPAEFSRDELPLNVVVRVTDDVLLDTVSLHYRHNGVNLGSLGMVPTGQDTFGVILPLDSLSVAIGDSMEYQIVAMDGSVFHNVDSTGWFKVYVYGTFAVARSVVLPIPDNNPSGVRDTLPVMATVVSPEAFRIADLDVTFTATHPYVGDLTVKLTSPSGQTVTLMQRPGPGSLGSSGDNPDITLSDEAATSIDSITFTGTQQVVGTFRPDPQALSLFDQEDVNGNWILQVLDSRTSQVGILTGWGLRIKTIASSVVTSSGRADRVGPASFHLHQNQPNPFNPTTTIRYSMQTAGPVTMTVYNLLGQEVRTLVSGRKAAGDHLVQWDGKDRQGAPVASGIYFYRLESEGKSLVRKMLLVK